MNETVRDYCRDAGIEFTRCRPWRKNDQAFVEQKNGAIIRRIVGYRRLEGPEAVAALSQLYATSEIVREFLPALIQARVSKTARRRPRVSKRYHPPATPFQRLLADHQHTAAAFATEVSRAVRPDPGSDPPAEGYETGTATKRLVDHCRPARGGSIAPPDRTVPPIERVSRRAANVAWKDGDVQGRRRGPAGKAETGPPQARSACADVTDQLREWFEAEPWRHEPSTARTAAGGSIPGTVIPTIFCVRCNARVQVWRQEKAHDLVFGPSQSDTLVPAQADKVDLALTTAVDNRLAAAMTHGGRCGKPVTHSCRRCQNSTPRLGTQP